MNIFPPPKEDWTWGALISPCLFYAIIAGLFVSNEYYEWVLFERPLWLLTILIGVWFWWLHSNGFSGITGYRHHLVLWTRLIVVALIAIILAFPRAARHSESMTVIFVVDQSDSVQGIYSEDAMYWAKDISAKYRNNQAGDKVGMVLFGKNSAVMMSPRATAFFENLAMNVQVDGEGTNIADALSMASAVMPSDTNGRIVLMTDGAQTDGDLISVLDDLKSRGIAVDVYPINYDYGDEVWIEKLETPKYPKKGHTYNASVIVSSLGPGRARLIVERNGEAIHFEDGAPGMDIEFAEGKNRYQIPFRIPDAGYYEFTARLERPRQFPERYRDSVQDNNIAKNYVNIQGEGQILIVTNPDFESVNENDYEPLVQALEKGEMNVELIDALSMPWDRLALMPYDCVVFVNVPRDALEIPQMEAMRDAVRNLGVGFVMVGGENSFGAGGYNKTAIEEALPVYMEVKNREIVPKAAMAIILHTCEFQDGNTWAKRITKQAIKLLHDDDDIGVLGFDWQRNDYWIVPMQPAAGRAKINQMVNGAVIDDMPMFNGTMNMAAKQLAASDAATKHMIIISDGDPSPPTPQTMGILRQNKIAVSCVEIFPHGGSAVGVMRDISRLTGGRYYLLNKQGDANRLPSIFTKITRTLKRSLLQERKFFPVDGGGVDDVGILDNLTEYPALNGYVLTTPKDASIRLLDAPIKKSQRADPVLATWRFGLGKTAAWTSDFSPRWGKDMIAWGDFEVFAKQLIQAMSRPNLTSHLRMNSYATSDEGVIVVEDHFPDSRFMDIVAQVSDPNGETQEIILTQVGPKRYEARFDLDAWGQYQIMATGKGSVIDELAGEDGVERAHGGFIVSYSPEYARFRSNPLIWNRVIDRTDGNMLNDENAKDIFSKENRENRVSSRPIWDWFLYAVCMMILMDVAVRRIQIDFVAIMTRLGLNRKAKSTATMGTLLAKKKDLDAKLRNQEDKPVKTWRPEDGERAPVLTEIDSDIASEAQAKAEEAKQRSKETKAKSEPPSLDTTTGRLLDLKRKREEERGDR